MRKNWLLIFAIILILFAIFSTKIEFHDTSEYVTLSKHLAGTKNLNIFTSHSLLYPFIISLFLKVWPSLITIKLVNVFWIFLIGFTLLKINNKTAFLLFAFSPLTWIAGIQTTPILPASFFFLLSFIFFKKNKTRTSGVFLGLSFAFYTPMILVIIFFMLIYFWNKCLKNCLIFLIAIAIGFLPRLIIDYYYFKMPFYSLIRYVGTNLIIFLGLHPATKNFEIITNFKVLLIFVAISPLFYKIYKIDFKNYKKEIVLLSIIFSILLLRASLLKYFIILSPVIILLLVKVLNKKDIKIHCIISIILILFFTASYFSPNELIIKEDLSEIKKDYSVDYIISGPFEAPRFAQYSWENKPYFVWLQDFEASIKNKTRIREYNFIFNSKIPLKNKLEISASFDRFEDKNYQNFIIVSEKKLEDYSQIKCYKKLCVYEL